MACRVMVSGGFLSVCPIYPHFIFCITFSVGSCLVHFQSVVLVTLRRHLLLNVCIPFSVFCVLCHVSDSWTTTALTSELNILSLVLRLICFAFQIVLNKINAVVAFCILDIIFCTSIFC